MVSLLILIHIYVQCFYQNCEFHIIIITMYCKMILMKCKIIYLYLYFILQATCNPVAYSLIADFFPPKHRAVALSIYHFGVYLGGGIGYICGALNHYLSWRWTYHILGIIGLATVPFSLITAWEPKSVKASRKRRKEEKKKNSTLRVSC